MTNEVEVPQKAVEAAKQTWRLLAELPNHEPEAGARGVSDAYRERIAKENDRVISQILQAAAPLIQGQDRRRFPDGTYCICPEHDLLMPYRHFHGEWITEEGCPVLTDGENVCGEPVQVVDPVALIRSQERQRVRGLLLNKKAIGAAARFLYPGAEEGAGADDYPGLAGAIEAALDSLEDGDGAQTPSEAIARAERVHERVFLREALKEPIEGLEEAACTFFACDGPGGSEIVPMKTCSRCAFLIELREILDSNNHGEAGER